MAVTYTPLPPAPVPGNRDFEVRAGAFLDAMPVFGAEMKAIADAVSEAATVVDVEGNATIAATAASQASIAATAATTQVNAVKLDVGKAAASATAAARSATAAALSASQSATNALATDQNAARAEAAAELADSDGNASVAQAAAATATAQAQAAAEAAAGAFSSAIGVGSQLSAAIAARLAAEAAKESAVAVVTGGTASLQPAPGKIPIADADGKIDQEWIRFAGINDIGVPGATGFGVGVCPLPDLGFSEINGTKLPGSDNYGNYVFTDGSVMVWVPRCWFKIGLGLAQNGLEAGRVDVRPASTFANESEANAAGYVSHRADWDGDMLRAGQFVDKYLVSANAGKASSIKGAVPMAFGMGASAPFSGVGASNSQYSGAIEAMKTRGPQFFCASRFIYAKLALLSLAHAQAAAGATHCAWYDATGVANFPKGCNNDALGDTNDAGVSYASAGISGIAGAARTGSGAPFAKTTHNGQVCGIADLNGVLREVSTGVTVLATSRTITGATTTNPVRITATAHGYQTGDVVMINNVGNMAQINNRLFKITVIDADTFSLNGVDGTNFFAYTSGGTCTRAQFYTTKKSARMADYTAGNELETDHWGAAGIAATMEAFTPEFRTDYSNNGFSQRYGSGTGAVFSSAASGAGWLLTGLGLPLSTGISVAGTNALGQDEFYQYVRNELCLMTGGGYASGTRAGVFAANMAYQRGTLVGNDVGARAAAYLLSM